MVPAPHLDFNCMDSAIWRDRDRNMNNFFVKQAWRAIRIRGSSVAWNQIVWFNHNIPRHAFHLWLIMRQRLKTQEWLRQSDVGPTVDLDLLVWNNIYYLARIKQEQPVLHDIVNYLQPMANNRMAFNIIGRIILAASSYYIWLERNSRIFKKVKKSPDEIKDTIMVMVRIKLLMFKFKNTAKVSQILTTWKMPSSFRLYG
nr:hypothetical protein [Tanacetum cinerariifolium]